MCDLGNISVIVPDHLDEEGLGFISCGLLQHGGPDDVDDGLAVVNQLLLDPFLIRS